MTLILRRISKISILTSKPCGKSHPSAIIILPRCRGIVILPIFSRRWFASGWWRVSSVLILLMLFGSLPGESWPGSWNLLMDWQPHWAWSQPWRWWTPVMVHYSLWHAVINLLGLILLACLGVAAKVPGPYAVAWCVAWPLTHLGLLGRPELLHFGGASGVLHAGMSIIAVWLIMSGDQTPPAPAASQPWGIQSHHQQTTSKSDKLLGGVMMLVLLGKVLHESPWGPAVQYSEGLGIFVAPWSHASGVLSGLICGAIAYQTRSGKDALQNLN